MSKSIKLKDNNYWDSASIMHGRRKLNEVLFGERIGSNSLSSNGNITIAVTCEVSLLILSHHSHGSCGGLYMLFRGTGTGNKVSTIIPSSHGNVEYENDQLKISTDGWGVGWTLIKII